MKVIYEESYGIWNGEEGIQYMPMCPKCKNPTYDLDECPFCGEKLEYYTGE